MIARELLKNKNLNVTPTRIKILELFGISQIWSYNSISEKLAYELDRVTLYRTLHTFTESGLIHKIPGINGNPQYALTETNDQHAHFKCIKCETTTCLKELLNSHIPLPDGYTACYSDIVIQGICKYCNAALSLNLYKGTSINSQFEF